MDLAAIPFLTADGRRACLGDHAGRVVLVVNTASKCGLTPQYDGLQALYSRFRDRGLTVIGFPANDFAGQEPGSDAEIQAFCTLTHGVEFPVMAKIAVTGGGQHPLYAALTQAAPVARFPEGSGFLASLAKHGIQVSPPAIHWNFEKFLIGRDGQVIARFSPDTQPEDLALVAAIETAL